MDGLAEDAVVPSLWRDYTHSHEYRQLGMTGSIPRNHCLVVSREQRGLYTIYKNFVHTLNGQANARAVLLARSSSEWLHEWKGMHRMLFRQVLRDCGRFRHSGEDVRFGDWADQEHYRIPQGAETIASLGPMVELLQGYLEQNYTLLDISASSDFLARIHFEFVRLHPFLDGNGRIARAITDQMALMSGLPAATLVYPRGDKIQQQKYHAAIRKCGVERDTSLLATWIREYIETYIDQIA